MAGPHGPGSVRGDGTPLSYGTRYTDNVARVYAVVKRHPEISVEWPRWSGKKEYEAHWPTDPADEHSEIRSVQVRELTDLATALEKEFPDNPIG